MSKISRPTTLWLGFSFFAAISLFVSWFVFELRYMWFLSHHSFLFLRIGFLLCIGLIILSWAVYPSRLFVGLIGIALFIFPPILRSQAYVQIDGEFAVWLSGAVLLLVATTEIDLRARRRTQW